MNSSKSAQDRCPSLKPSLFIISHNSLTSCFSGAKTQAEKEKKDKPQRSAPLVDNSIAPNLGSVCQCIFDCPHCHCVYDVTGDMRQANVIHWRPAPGVSSSSPGNPVGICPQPMKCREKVRDWLSPSFSCPIKGPCLHVSVLPWQPVCFCHVVAPGGLW